MSGARRSVFPSIVERPAMKVVEAIWNQVSAAVWTLISEPWELDALQGAIIIGLLLILAVPAIYIQAAVANRLESRRLRRNGHPTHG